MLLAAASAILIGACTSLRAPAPAVLASGDPATLSALRAALAQAMGQAQVELGPGDPTQSPIISVLPRPPGPLEDRSLALPTIFLLETQNGQCFLVREEGGARTRIEGVFCKPA